MSGLICSACRSALNRPSRLGSHLTDLADAGVFEMTKSLRWPVSRQNYSSRAFRGLPNLRVLCEGPNREFRTTATHQRTFASTAGGDGSSRRSLSNLPDKVEVLTGPLGRLSKVLQPRRSDSITTRVGSSYGGNHSLEWVQPPNNVLIVKKQNDVRALEAMKELIRHIREVYPNLNVIVEPDSLEELTRDASGGVDPSLLAVIDPTSDSSRQLLSSKTDFVITLGGDGSILHVSSLFSQSAVPPVLSFSMGTLGFLLPYDISSYEIALRSIMDQDVGLMLRMRLRQTLHDASGGEICSDSGSCKDIHLMNEIALHRGREPHMTVIDAFVNGKHLTRAISDGLIVATPTGSTAYSLSAGGPIVHPSVQSLVLTPICPRSLSFRTVLLPSDTTVQLKVARESRSPADLSVDGRHLHTLQPGQYLQVSMSPFPLPCVNFISQKSKKEQQDAKLAGTAAEPRLMEVDGTSTDHAAPHGLSERGEDTWVRDINTLLRFNASFNGRGVGTSSEDT